MVELFQLVCNVVGYSLALLTVSSHARASDESTSIVCLTAIRSHGKSVAVNAGVRDETAFIKIILHALSTPTD